ncbi:ABC transporter substrate-binding protein [Nesterenkonia sp. MY13]|uniref:ABC transporter substrate-binding protein n=1 Tax=Nesterenkonia sedimenti TaxID=1463632 RepID=A0A7X8TL77_9MICC|nr:ABC transporter substrate-binding protein [Nesterenkonia sedimenti]NLS10827.1 ABC transporter substrate-binding protein [Nesterenkonia sedimenti]
MRNSTLSATWKGTAVFGMAALVLTACGPDTSGESAEDQVADTDWSDVEPADEITFATNHPGGSEDQENELIEQFTEETGIEVNVITSGADYEETNRWFQTGGGDNADVIVLSDATWFPNYLNGALAPVDDLLEAADVDSSGYVEALYEDYLYEDHHYGVPYARSTPLFYYNVDHFEEAGLDGAPETWEEVAEYAQTIVDEDIASYGYSFPPSNEYPAWGLANLVWGYGGGWSDEWDLSMVSSDATAEAIEFAQSGVQDGWAHVSASSQTDDFSSGVSSMTIQSTGSLGGILEAADFEVGTAFLPDGPAAEGETPTGGAGLMIASASDPEEQLAAAMFVGHMTSAESQAYFSEATGYVPSHQDADMSSVYEEQPQFETAVEQLDRARVQDHARVFLPGADLELAETLQDVLSADADVREELERVQAEFEELYETELADELE